MHPVRADLNFQGTQRARNVADPVLPGDAVNHRSLKAEIARRPTPTATPLSGATVVDAALSSAVAFVVWSVVIRNTSGATESWEVSASHDGSDTFINTAGQGPDLGNLIDVELSGSGPEQRIRLVITPPGAGWTAHVVRVALIGP